MVTEPVPGPEIWRPPAMASLCHPPPPPDPTDLEPVDQQRGRPAGGGQGPHGCLVEDKERREVWMVDRVKPLLDGNNVVMLLLYHNLLDHDTHVEALTLVSEAGNINIDFKLLEEGNKEAFKFINKENVDIQLLKFWIFLPTRM